MNERAPDTETVDAELVAVEMDGPGDAALVPVSMGMLQAANPAEMMAAAAAIATPLKKFILEKGLYVELGGAQPHVYVEAWTTLAAMCGTMVQEISVEEKPIDLDHYPDCGAWGPKYVAKMALVRTSDQQVVTSASAECGGPDERSWHWRPKYEWSGPQNDRQKKLVGETPVSGSQRRSMAITRATGKCSRLAFSWVMTLAGYSTTPAEEFNQDDHDRITDPIHEQKKEQRPEGRNPRDTMGTRGSYHPGGHNPAPQGTREKKKTVEPKFMEAKFASPCRICSKEIKPGEMIAFLKTETETRVAHADCYNAQEAK